MAYSPIAPIMLPALSNDQRSSRLTRAASSILLTSRWLTKNNSVLPGLARWIEGRHGANAPASAGTKHCAVPRLSPAELKLRTNRRAIGRFAGPICCPGFAANSLAVQNWTPEYFQQRFGMETLRVATEEFAFQEMPVPEIVDRILSADPQKQRYVQAVSDIFIKRPDIFDDLPMKAIFDLQRHGYHGAELFLGGPGTGSTWHAANEWNFFLQIHGEKKWKLLRPDYTVSMRPAFQRDLIYVTSTRYSYESPEQFSVFETTLKPGDLLIVPPWWWHCVQNTTASSIAVSLRFRTLRQYLRSPNPTLSLLQLTAPHQWRNFWEEGVRGRLKNDSRYHHRADRLVR